MSSDRCTPGSRDVRALSACLFLPEAEQYAGLLGESCDDFQTMARMRLRYRRGLRKMCTTMHYCERQELEISGSGFDESEMKVLCYFLARSSWFTKLR